MKEIDRLAVAAFDNADVPTFAGIFILIFIHFYFTSLCFVYITIII